MRYQRQNLRSAQNGFTLVELLIVIVVIAVLAAITIVAYNNIAQRASQAVLKSDLSQAETQLETTKVDNGSYPLTSDVSSGAYKLKSSGTTKLEYTSDGTSYLLTASSSGAKTSYCFGSVANLTSNGPCTGQIGYVPSGAWVVTTFAGSTAGYLNGTGTSAQFASPASVATDTSGNIYVAEGGNNCIRKITSAGVVSTIAGNCSYLSAGSFADGTGTAARFNYPSDLVLDPSGNIYVTDANNNRIRKITPGGVVTTLAGSSLAGYTNGTGTNALFSSPYGIAIDSSGNLYVADADYGVIRKITPGGVVTTLAGMGSPGFADGTGAAAQFNYPVSIALDSSGNAYVSDNSNTRIRKVTPGGVVTTLAGSSLSGVADGTGASAKFSSPMGIDVDSSGNVYVVDDANTYNGIIRKITPAGVVTTIAGNSSTSGYVDGVGTSAQFSWPFGIAIDPSGKIFVADSQNNRIRQIIQQP